MECMELACSIFNDLALCFIFKLNQIKLIRKHVLIFLEAGLYDPKLFNQGLITLDRLFIHYSFNSSGLKGSWLICPVSYYGKDISASDSSTSTSWLKRSSPKSLQLKCLDLKVSVEKSDDEMSRNRTQN